MSEENITEIIADIEEQLDSVTVGKIKNRFLRESRFDPIQNLSNMATNNPSVGSSNLATNNPSAGTSTAPIFQTTNAPQQLTSDSINIRDSGEINLLLRAIPEYYPGDNLSIFVNEVDNLINHLRGRLTPDLDYVVSFSIRSKIKGDARDFISHQNATDWLAIRNALLSKYGDQRSEELLESSLRHCIQKRNESYMDYYARILKAHNELMQYVTLHTSDANYLNFRRHDYSKLALKTFQIGLLEPYRSYLSNFDLLTIEECINKCRYYDNRKYEWEYCEFLRRNSSDNSKQNTKISPNKFRSSSNHSLSFNKSFSSQNLQQYPNLYQNNQSSFHASRENNFPSNNSAQRNFSQLNQNRFNYSPRQFESDINRPLPPKKVFSNKDVFGTKPGSNISQIRNKPTPMSIQSRVNTQRVQMNQPSTSRLPYIVEELYNGEIDNLEEIENEISNNDEIENPLVNTESFPEYEYQENYNFSESNDNENFRTTASETLE